MPRIAMHAWCEPAQLKRTSTCHKKHFMIFYVRILRKNVGAQMEHRDQAWVFTTTVGIPQCGHTVWRKTLLGGFLT